MNPNAAQEQPQNEHPPLSPEAAKHSAINTLLEKWLKESRAPNETELNDFLDKHR